MFRNRSLIIIGLIALINALGYGIIIPIIYSYSLKFGLNNFQNGLLFATFSLCQFLATPFIGKLSDKYGRKPLLVISLAGTALSFFLAAFASSAWMLFLARALDGITAGNIPVASAVISDTTEPKDRAKGFGIIGASFGFGFVFGPAISALTIGFGISVPFIIAGVIAVFAVLATAIFLPETNKNIHEHAHVNVFDIAHMFPIKRLFFSLFDEKVGDTLKISLIYSCAFGLFIFAFQPFAVQALHFTPRGISTIYIIFGVIGLISQLLIIPRAVKWLGEKKVLAYSLALSALGFTAMFFSSSREVFIVISIFFSLSNSVVNPVVQALLSREVSDKEQGAIMGLNASYYSVGTIFGPIVGGLLATFLLPLPFLAGTFIALVCLWIAVIIVKKVHFVR